MINKLVLTFIALAAYLVPTQCYATPESIKNDKGYQESLRLISKFGRDGAIKLSIELQREQMEKYGDFVDQYTRVLSITANRFGFIQTTQVDIDSMLKDANNMRLERGKEPAPRSKILSLYKDGGKAYQYQANMTCSMPASRAYIDNDIEYAYKNVDKNMKFISYQEVNKEVCAKLNKAPLTDNDSSELSTKPQNSFGSSNAEKSNTRARYVEVKAEVYYDHWIVVSKEMSTHKRNYMFDVHGENFVMLPNGDITVSPNYISFKGRKSYFEGGGAFWYDGRVNYKGDLIELISIRENCHDKSRFGVTIRNQMEKQNMSSLCVTN